jgi:hypothetical protein
MNNRHSKDAYPFAVERGERADAYGGMSGSEDGSIEYWLTRGGWYYQKEAQEGGYSSEGTRTVLRTLQETNITEVLKFTAQALDAGWFLEDRDDLRDQLGKAQGYSNRTTSPARHEEEEFDEE